MKSINTCTAQGHVRLNQTATPRPQLTAGFLHVLRVQHTFEAGVALGLNVRGHTHSWDRMGPTAHVHMHIQLCMCVRIYIYIYIFI